ncbi:MAG: HAMP domain-containing histidine kinase [Acidobacteriota bacterium]|jgi:two-component system sensor histidine kinase GlrK|nr:HAMP domain-containing histidine kinase [Acidobacteriota bacterium]
MRITTRISLGYGLLLAILLGLAAYQAYAIKRMQSINRTVAEMDFRNSLACIESMRNFDLVEEYARKSFALGDADYLNLLREYRQDFTADLRSMKNLATGGAAKDEIDLLARQWDALDQRLAFSGTRVISAGNELPESMRQDFESLGARLRSVYQANLGMMSLRVENARRTGETAALVLIFTTLAAVAIGGLVSFFIYRSISKPLAHLTEGTRAIAEGKFFYRLDTSRRDEFSQLARDFNAMTRRLAELDKMKKDFVAHVSHELKSPLASMRETIELMLDEIPGTLNEKQRRLLDLNRQSGVRLTALIGNLLDLSRTEAGVMEYELKAHNLAALARDVIEETEVLARERDIQIRTSFPEEPIEAECDGDRIIQVLVNILTNAVKFSPKSSEIDARIEAIGEPPENLPASALASIAGSEHGGGFALITVSDRGPGIPATDREKIFEKFYQAEHGKKAPGQGAGLGLAICMAIMQAHRGAIWAEDNPGGGGRFRVLLSRLTADFSDH